LFLWEGQTKTQQNAQKETQRVAASFLDLQPRETFGSSIDFTHNATCHVSSTNKKKNLGTGQQFAIAINAQLYH